jgi:hypothetical protein
MPMRPLLGAEHLVLGRLDLARERGEPGVLVRREHPGLQRRGGVQRDRVGAGGGLDAALVGAVRGLIFSALGVPVNLAPAILIVTSASSSGA